MYGDHCCDSLHMNPESNHNVVLVMSFLWAYTKTTWVGGVLLVLYPEASGPFLLKISPKGLIWYKTKKIPLKAPWSALYLWKQLCMNRHCFGCMGSIQQLNAKLWSFLFMSWVSRSDGSYHSKSVAVLSLFSFVLNYFLYDLIFIYFR